MTAAKRAPCITLTTDFGTADGYVGAMKGILASRAPGVPIIDLTHAIPRHDVAAAAFALAQAASQFPAGAVHLAVVDPGVGGRRRPVVLRAEPHLFVGPDNGLFELAAPARRRAFAIEAEAFRRRELSSTFHGRDLFAPAAAALAMGAPPEHAGPEIELSGSLPGAHQDAVIHVDHFGNLITAIPRHRVPAGARVELGGRAIPLVTTYVDVAAGELLAYIGSADTLEIAAREASAAELLGAGRGARVVVTIT
jgi:S-adenosyl-L-methionine hydrolase (adenosine-forming)